MPDASSSLRMLRMPVQDQQGPHIELRKRPPEVMGKRSDELLGMSVFDLSPPDLAQVYFDEIMRL